MSPAAPPRYATLVAGTDGSDTSLLAVERAAHTAADSGARLVLVCAYYPATGREQAALVSGVLGHHPITERDAEAVLGRARERAGTADDEIALETAAVAAHPGQALLDVAADRDADVIVVGDRGLSAVAGHLLGSVPTQVMRQAPCDVLVVHTTDPGA